MEPARFQCRVICSNSRVEIEEDPRDPRTEAAHPQATSATSQGFKESSAGTWLKLLQYVGLQDLDIGKDDLQITAADYLPDDILAVPAYADLGFIVAVVAAAGAYSFKTDSQSVYPVIIGDGFQFDFRQHPQLGMLGAFSRYGKTIGSIETPSTDQIIRALRHSRGEIEIGPSFLVDAAAKEDADATARDRSRAAAQEETQKQPLNIFFPAKPAGILQTLTSHECERPSTLCRCSPDLDWDDDYHLLWLFVAKLPEEIPATFPSKQSNFGKILQMLALNSRFWSSPPTDRVSHKDLPSFLKTSAYRSSPISPPRDPTAQDFRGLSSLFLLPIHELDKPGSDASKGYRGLNEAMSPDWSLIYTRVLEASVKLLLGIDDFMAWFDTIIGLRKQYFRMLVQLQLVKVDQLLKSRNQRGAVSCQAISLLYTTLALLDSESAINNNSFGVSQSHSSQKIGWNSLNVDDGPRNDLIVRHFPTLKGLGSFFDTIPVDYGALEDDPRMSSIFKNQLAGVTYLVTTSSGKPQFSFA